MKVRNLIIIGVMTYLCVLVVKFPASLVIDNVWPKGGNVPQLLSTSGSIWNGQITVSDRSLGELDVGWDLKVSALFTANAVADIEVSSAELNFKGNVKASASNLEVENGDLFVSPSLVNRFIRGQQASMEGDIEGSRLAIAIDYKNRVLEYAGGQIIWHGGAVNYRDRGQSRQVTSPLIMAGITHDAGALVANITDQKGSALGKVNVKPDGWAGVEVRKRLIDLIQVPYSGNEAADDIVFEVSEKLF